MDFVVVGFGLGALVVLLGLGLRLWGPRRWPVEAEHPLGAAGLAKAVQRGRICRACGAIVAVGGVILLGATVLAVVGQAGDEAGDLIVLAAGLTALGMVALWAIAFSNRRWLDPALVRLTAWSERRWVAVKQSRDQNRARRQAAQQRRRRAAARPQAVPRKPQPREAPRPDVDRGWLPPLPLDDDYDWQAPPSESSNGNANVDDVPTRRVVGR